MSQNERDTHFGMSYPELVNLSYEKETLLRRDQSILNSRGITIVRIDAFKALRNTFMNVPTDLTMKALITVAIEGKDEVANETVMAIREILGIAKNKYGENSGAYKAFNSTDLTRLNAGELCILSLTIVKQANDHLTDLQPFGLTAAMITNLGTLKTSLEGKINDVNTAESNQVSTTELRHSAANNLFDEMRSMCDTARVYFADRDPLKAEEYVIYDTAGSEQQRNGVVAVGEVVYRSFEGLETNTIFKLQVKDGNDLVFYFSQTEGGTAGTKTVVVGVDPNNYTEATADDLGFDRTTGYIKFNIRNNGSVESTYRVVVE